METLKQKPEIKTVHCGKCDAILEIKKNTYRERIQAGWTVVDVYADEHVYIVRYYCPECSRRR